MPQRVVVAVLAFVWWCMATGLAATASAVTPLGGDFQINTYTTEQQYRNRLEMSSTGAFVVTWSSEGVGGDGFEIFARRYDSAGAAQGAEFQVNSSTYQDQQYPALSIDAADLFVVAWRSNGQDGDNFGIFAQRFDASGARQGAEFQVNTYTLGPQKSADVAVGPGGGFFVVWESEGQDGSDSGIFARRHNGSGIPQATEFQVNVFTTDAQAEPRILIASPSALIVVWRSFQDGSSAGLFGRRVGQSGAVGGEFQINAYTPGGQTLPALAATGDGGFVVVWQSFQDGDATSIVGRRFDSAGAPTSGEFQINAFTVGSQVEADVAGSGTEFVAVWHSAYQDGDADGIFARRFDGAGVIGDEFQVNSYTPNVQRRSSVGVKPSGDFVVTWDSLLQDGSYNGVFARRFSLIDAATLDIDGDGTTEPLTDGLLVLRYMFGFTGTTLTGGAVDADCTRCDAAAIVPYLIAIGGVLDVDDDGEREPLTDGLLVLRFLFGFGGTTLTAGAVDSDCMRCDAAAIVPYLQGLV